MPIVFRMQRVEFDSTMTREAQEAGGQDAGALRV